MVKSVHESWKQENSGGGRLVPIVTQRSIGKSWKSFRAVKTRFLLIYIENKFLCKNELISMNYHYARTGN